MPTTSKYDIAIIGAGPAGLAAGLALKNSGQKPSVILLDKITPWEKPLACAEAVGSRGLRDALSVIGETDMPPSWIRYQISSATFHAPNGLFASYHDAHKGYIINRMAMQSDMADAFVKWGGRHCLDGKVTYVSPVAGGMRRIELDNGDSIEASAVIDASGPVSRFGQTEDIRWKAPDLEPAYFAIIDNVECQCDSVHIYIGQQIAPGGYAWVFPREERSLNVGVLVGSTYIKRGNIRALLASFIKTNFPNGKIRGYFSGAIPCTKKRCVLALPGLIKAGDAASAVNPVSRAGIAESMFSGAFAAQHALRMLGASTIKEQTVICKDYEKIWWKKRGKTHAALAKVKPLMAQVPDEDFNKGTEALAKIPQDQLTMLKIFALVVGRFPKLVWALRHLL